MRPVTIQAAQHPSVKRICGLLLLSLLISFAQVRGQETSPQEVLTNDAVVQMVQAHLGVDVIVEQIRTSRGNYVLNSSSLISLRQQGVPDAVISAMQAKKSGDGRTVPTKPTPSGLHETAGSQGKVAPRVWQVDNVADRISGKTRFEGFMWQRTEGSQQTGELQATATCDTDVLNLQIVFLSDAKPGIGLKQNTTGGFGHAKPWVEMRVRIDNDQPRVVTSENDYLNYATIVFSKWAAQGRSREDGAASIARYLLAAKSAGTIEKAIQARSVLVELTTENNAKELLEINPQEPSFKVFASRCSREFWGNVTPSQQQPRGPIVSGVTPSQPQGSGPSAGRPAQFQQTAPRPAADGFKFLVAIPMADRDYTGTVEGFVTAFPAFLKRAADAGGFSDRDYSKETAFIIDAVRTCGKITPEIAASVFEPNGKKLAGGRMDGTENFTKLGPEYEVCSGANDSFAMRTSATHGWVDISPRVTGVSFKTRRGISVRIEPRLGAMWKDGKGFLVEVLFSQMDGDLKILGRLNSSDYVITNAFIPKP